ncbi:hypothetical protein [Niabella soli]|uniref:Peptidase M50 n=1 Tax=Niabella soli DSM 19437 TaxID=929713 RepID=W0F400_9BACT|nr:hypothetical protein [Niabella soli]AHF17785.1 hypothetical protein NIASO_14215 [Niabella soli DSM 19437]
MKRSFKTLTLNSILLFSIASILEMTLHEFGHYVTARYFHAAGAKLFHNYVDFDENSIGFAQRLCIAAAGPLVSLLIGISFHLFSKKATVKKYGYLFLLYLSASGYIGFLGYLMVAPFFTYGDTGLIFNQLHFPVALIIVIAVAAAFVLFLVFRQLAVLFIRFADEETIKDIAERRRYTKAVILYPLLGGIIITTLLNLPVPTTLSLIAPLCSPFSMMWIYGAMLNRKQRNIDGNPFFAGTHKMVPAIIAGFTAMVIINRLLVLGI